MTLEILWFCLLAFFWTGYFVLEGFDFGVGMLLPVLGRSEDDRSTMFESIGPVWDGNEVWLVIAGGATFAAFPVWYATMFSGFYLALLLILVLLIVRVLSFEWRGKADELRLEGVLGLDEHDRVDRRAAPLGHRAREPAARRPDRAPTRAIAGDFGDLFSGYTVLAGSRGLPALRAPRRGLPHAAHARRPPRARPTHGVAPRAGRRRSSAPASSSGRSSSRAT